MSVFVFSFLSQLNPLFLSFTFDGFVQLWQQVVEAHLCPSNRIFPQNVVNLSFKNMKAFMVSVPIETYTKGLSFLICMSSWNDVAQKIVNLNRVALNLKEL